MPVLIPVKASVKVVRKGKRVAVPAGKPFQFTDEEVKTINTIMPGALRAPVVEKFVAEEDEDDDGEDTDLDAEDEGEDKAEATGEKADASSAKKTPAKKSGAKKAAATDDDI